jgi:PII-like signaling protein
MTLEGPAKRLTIFIGESDRYHHHSLCSEIVERARRRGLAGCSVFRGTEGFGATGHLHTTRLLSLSEDLPVAIVIVDSARRIDEFRPELDELITGGLVMVEDVEVVRYVGNPAGRSTSGEG